MQTLLSPGLRVRAARQLDGLACFAKTGNLGPRIGVGMEDYDDAARQIQ